MDICRFRADLVPEQLQEHVRLFSELKQRLSSDGTTVIATIMEKEQIDKVIQLGIPCSKLNLYVPMIVDQFTAISNFSTLTHVRVCQNAVNSDLLTQIHTVESIESLEIAQCLDFPAIAPVIKQIVVENKNIKKLEVDLAKRSNNAGLDEIVDALSANTTLEIVSIGAVIDSDIATKLCTAFEQNTTLKFVDLSRSVMSIDVARQFLGAFSRVRINFDTLTN